MSERNEPRQIMLVEDEPALRDNYTLALSRAGHHVIGLSDPAQVLDAVDRRMPDAIIIDIGLGRDSEAGFELCRRLRERSARLPILFLTARDSELDLISGLRLGADDYMTKDISLAQLVTRVGAVLRRVDAYRDATAEEPTRSIGPLALNLARLQARWRGQIVELTVTEFWLVECLSRHPGQVRSRQQLMAAADLVLDDQTITAHVKRIRARFLSLDPAFSAIGTVYGQGYRWIEMDH